jgi:hypothetical protein
LNIGYKTLDKNNYFTNFVVLKILMIYKIAFMKYILFVAIAILGVSCRQSGDSNLEQLDKKSAREVSLKAVEVGDSILHITEQNIWANGQLIAQKSDTIKTAKQVPNWDSTTPTTLVKTPIYVTVE